MNKLINKMRAFNLALYKLGYIDKEGLEFYDSEFDLLNPPAASGPGIKKGR